MTNLVEAITINEMVWFTLILAMPVILGFGWTIQSIVSPPKRELRRSERSLRLFMFFESIALLGLWCYVLTNFYY